VRLNAQDKSVQIKDVLLQEPFASYIAQGVVNEKELEKAVFTKVYVDDEGADIQKMIAQFYNKFDELHEQSLTAALAKSPNKQNIKNEVKYRIPTRWTKNFHKQDVVSMDIYKDGSIAQERGRVNKEKVID